MTTMVLAMGRRTSWRLPEFALVLGISVTGLVISFAFVATTWADGPMIGA